MQSDNNGPSRGDFAQPIGVRHPARKAHRRQKISAAISGMRMMEKLETRTLLSAAGTLDTNFNLNGKVITDFGAEDQATSIAVDTQAGNFQNDLVVAGVINGDFSVAVYNSSGAKIASISNVIGTGFSQADAVTIDSSGRILVAGYADNHTTNNDFVLARYILSGSANSPTLALDTSFGTGPTLGDGYVTTDLLNGAKADVATSIAIDAINGDILVAGETGTGSTEHVALVAYQSSNGALDTSFGTGGEVVTNGAADQANAVAVGSNGTIILAGQTAAGEAEIINLGTTGSSFTKDLVNLGGISAANAVVAQGNDYLIAGTTSNQFVLAEVTSVGGLVSAFGTGGEVLTSIGTFAQANSLAVQSNGKIVLAGLETDAASGQDFFALARYDANGTIDASFGTGGVVTTDFTGNASASSIATGIAIQPDGLIDAAGFTGVGGNTDNFAVARYVANNAPIAANSTASLDSIAENDDSSAGTSVATLVTGFGMTDPDGDTVGLAITGVNDTYGTWQYSTDGSNWTTIPSGVSGVSDGNALLLAPSAFVRFQTTTNDTGSSSITVRAWDQTTGSNATFANVTTNTNANYNSFSALTYTASIAVVPATPPTVVYVDAAWSGNTIGSNVVDGFGQHTFGSDAFATIQAGVNAVAPGGTVNVDAGNYTEDVSITTPLSLIGNGSPNLTAPGSASDAAIISVAAANVTIEGFDIIVDQPHAAAGIAAVSGASGPNVFNGLQVLNNVITTTGSGGALNTAFGTTYSVGIAALANGGGTAPTVVISGNSVLSNATSFIKRAVWANEAQGTIGGATPSQGNTLAGIDEDALVAFSRGATSIENNAFDGVGVTITEPNADAPTTISDNSFDSAFGGVDDASLEIKHNYNASSPVIISGNIFTVSPNSIGVLSGASIDVSVSGNTFTPAAGATGTVDVDVDTMIPSGSQPVASTLFPNSISITGNTFNAGSSTSATAIEIANHDAGGDSPNPDFGAIVIGGAGTLANTFDKNLQNFIVEAAPSSSVSFSGDAYSGAEVHAGNVPVNIDASQNNFGVTSGDALGSYTLADYYQIEDKIVDGIDYSGAGLVSINPGVLYVTPNSFIAPATDDSGAIQRAVNLASSGNTINVEAGTFNISAGVTIGKQITLSGAMAGVSGTDVSRGTGETVLNGSANQSDAAFTINTTAAVTLDGFTFNGSKIIAGEPADSDLAFVDNVLNLQAMAASNETNIILSDPNLLTLTDNHFITTGFNPTNSAVIQIAGDYAGGADATNNVDVTGNTFTGIANFATANPGNGQSTLQLNLASVQGTVQNNTFDGVDIGVLIADSSGNLTIDSNTFENITRGATEIANGSYGAGILIFTPSFTNGPITISNNIFENSDSGIRTSNAGGTVAGATINITGNTFTGNVYNIVDKVAGTLTPDGTNSFDGVTLSGASLSQLYAIEDKIVDAIDVSGYGLVQLVAGNIYVTPNSFFTPGGTTAASIQRGVDAASSGDTVNVEAGTFVGQVSITKNLSLIGAGQGSTIIDPSASLATEFTTSSAKNPIIYANSNAVTIQDLTVDGEEQGNGYGDGFLGIAYYNAGGTVNNVTIENIENSPFNGVQNGVALYADNTDSVSRSLTVTNDTINNYQKNAMALSGAALTVDVEDNMVTGAGPTTAIAQNGIQVGFGAGGTVKNNTVTGNSYTGSQDADSAGILMYESAASSVTGNIVEGSDVGISVNLTTGNTTISDNKITGSPGAGISVYDSQVAIDGNTIESGVGDGGLAENTGDGIDIFDDNSSTTATLDSNTITGNTGVGLSVEGTAGQSLKVLAQNNVITGDSEGVVVGGGATVDLGTDAGDSAHQNFTGLGTSVGNNTLTGYTGVGGNFAIDDQNTPQGGEPDVLAEDNNFGPYSPNDPSAIAQVISDHHNNSLLTTVFYLPAQSLLTAPTTVYVNGAWAGSVFGSDPGSLGNGNSYGYDEFSDIQSAINAVGSGGTVMIDAGTYDPSNILIDIPVTIEGASESGVIITPSLTDSHDDSSFGGAVVSNGFIIASSGVTIEDLTLDGGAGQNFRDGIITNSQNDGNTYSNIKVENVTIENVYRKGIALYNFAGESTGNVIENDTFSNIGTTIDDYEGTAAIAVFSSDATIENNVITDSAGGIEGNAEPGAGSPLLTVSDNQISLPSTIMANGALGIDVASLVAGSSVSGNTVNLTGGTGNDIGNSIGIVESFDQGAVTVSGNIITGTGGDDGILLYQNASSVTVSDNNISGTSTGTGILVTAQNSDTSRFGDVAGADSATLTGNIISGYANGVEVVSDGASGDTASADIGDGTDPNANIISGDGVGILVTGSNATADINDNSISGNTNGIEFAGSGSGSISNNNFAGNPVNGTDLNIEGTAGAVTDGGGNKFAGTQYIDDLAAADTLDASADSFSGDSAGSLTLAQAYAVEDRISDYLDNASYGYVELNPAIVYVSQLSDTINGAIQRGVNVASTGGTVNVQAGTFVGQVSITENLSLIGAGQGSTIIDPSATLSSLFTDSNAEFPIVYANASNVTIQALTVDGTNSGNSYGDGFLGIAYFNAGGTVDHVTITNIENDPFNGVQNGVALLADNADGSPRTLNITNNTINNYQKNGMTLGGNGLTLNVQDNVVTGAGSTTQIAQNGIEVDPGATGTISDNTVSGNEYSGASGGPSWFADVQSSGLLLDGGPGLRASGNIIDGNDIGIIDNGTGATISDNQLGNTTANRYFGILQDQGSTMISDNTIKNGNDGIFVVTSDGDPSTTTAGVSGNTISGAGVGLEAIVQTPGDPAVDIMATGNFFTGNGDGVVIAGASATIANNDIVDNTTGVDMTGGSATIHNNYISNNSADGIDIGAAVTGNVVINDNFIAHATPGVGLDNASTGDTVNADFNWWGSASGPNAAGNPAGAGDQIIGSNVSYTPWLNTAGTHTNPGFQPDNSQAVSINGSSTGTEGAVYTLNLNAPSSDVTSWTINWGDGTISLPDTQTVSGTATSVTHTFAEFGNYTISAVAQTNSGPVNSDNSVSVAVADAALTVTGGVTLNSTEGSTTGTVTVATLTDAAGTFSNPSDLTAMINWGDGNTTAGTLSEIGNTGVYNVQGAHTYAEFGTYTIQASVTDGGGQSANDDLAPSTADVADAALTVTGGVTLNSTEGSTTGTVTVATLTDAAGTFSNPSDLTAMINWGDGNTTAGTLSEIGNTGVYNVQGAHTYAEFGTYTIQASVTDGGGQSANDDLAPSTADVADAALTVTGGVTLNSTEGSTTGTVTVATLTDAAGTFSNPSDLTAMINWGDGNTTAGTLSEIGNTGVYNVQGAHTYAEFGTYTIQASVTDGGGQSANDDLVPSTADVADAALTVTGGVTLNSTEGSTTGTVTVATLTDAAGTFSNPSDLTAMINWGDGNTTAGTLSEIGNTGVYNVQGAHTYAEFGTYTIQASVTDGGGQSANDDLAPSTANVADVAPSDVSISAMPSRINEDATTSLSGSFTDPGLGDTHVVTINWGDGSANTTVNLAAGVEIFSGVTHQYLDNPVGQPDGSFAVSVTVTDNDNESASSGTSVEVDNVAPTASLHVNSAPDVEGSAIDLTASAVDPSPTDQSAGFTYIWTVTQQIGNGPVTTYASGSSNAGTATQDINFTPNLAGTYVVSVTATDKDGGVSAIASQSFTVATTPPTVDLTQSATTTNEGSVYTLKVGTVTDPGPNDVTGYSISWGDGNITSALTGGSPQGLNITHTYEDGPNNYTIEVTIIDSEKVSSNVASWNVQVDNVAPVATLQNLFPTLDVGSGGEIALINPFDPSPVDTAAGFTYYYDLTDNISDTAGSYVSNGSNNAVVVPGSAFSTPGVKFIGERIEDKDGGFTDYIASITVDDVAPVVNLGPATTASQGLLFTQNGTFSYPGNNGPYTAMVDYNYLAGGPGDPGFAALTLNGNSFTLSHTYATTGNYVIEVKVTDASGTTGTGTLSVTVNPSNFQVTNFTPTASGFDVTFNRAANLNVLNLYSGTGGIYGSPDVILTGPGGTVTGSLIWNSSTDTAEFIKTGLGSTPGVLAAGNYTATLVSSSSAWEDTNGNLLQSNDPSGNYVANFTVGALGDIVSLSDFARGPGQAVNLPTTGTSGIPINLSDGSNVTAVDFDLSYDPTLLTITGVTKSSLLTSLGWSLTFNNSTPGLLQVTVSGTTPLGSGVANLVNLVATVPSNAAYGAGAALNITNLRINEGNIAGTADSAVEKVAFLGDADGSEGYDGLDASYISDVVAHLATGFDAYPLIDPTIIGDVTQDGTLSGQDASNVAVAALLEQLSQPVNVTYVNFPNYTPLPALTLSPMLPTTGLDPAVSIPSDILANPNGLVTVPINIDNATGVESADFTVSFDTSELSLSNVTLGTVDASGFTLNYLNLGGEIAIDAFADSPLASGSGSMFDLNFSVQNGAATGITPVTIAAPQGDGLNAGTLPTTLTSGSVDIHVPTVQTPAAADPNPVVTGTSTVLSVLGADDAGESNLTYTWSYTGPTGVTYSGATNGTNAAKNITAVFSQAGDYDFIATITDAGGFSVSSQVDVTVDQTTTNVVVLPASSPVVPVGFTQQFTASATDQFGNPITSFAWGISGNGNSIDGTGNATLGSTPGSFTVTAGVGAVQGTATVIAENFAVPVGSTLDINLGSAGPVAISASGGNITASQNGVQITLSGFTGVTVTDTGSNDVLNFNGPLALPFTFVNCGTSTVNVNSGTLTFAADMGGTINLGDLSVADGASAVITAATTNSATTLSLSSLLIGTTGTLDVANNQVLINYGSGISPISTIAGWIDTGYAGGAWNGHGIMSSVAQTNPNYGLGYADSGDAGNPANLPSGEIKIMYTLLGDANLDGTVNSEDFTPVSHNQGLAGMMWDDGDFNYDGTVNSEDFTPLSHNLGQTDQIAATTLVQAGAAAVPATITVVSTAIATPVTAAPPATAAAPVTVAATPAKSAAVTPAKSTTPATSTIADTGSNDVVSTVLGKHSDKKPKRGKKA